MLKSCDETNGDDVYEAAGLFVAERYPDAVAWHTAYEHGQWWLIVSDPYPYLDVNDSPPLTFSVVDAEPGYEFGLDFEEV